MRWLMIALAVGCVAGPAGAQTPPNTPGTIEIAAINYSWGQNVAPGSGAGAVWGSDTLLNAPPYTDRPDAAEWRVFSPDGGRYDLWVRYAAAESRPVHIRVNGDVFLADALGAPTGCWTPDCRKWVDLGAIQLRAGDNVVRFERASYFPHLNLLRFVPAP